ncbi:MAG: glutamine--fructose-6-phosphate transaminase (isomerizing) [Parcubacteria group bacterium]|nr:glutamine--fructose-6-phosphate transaminase (isomerizing) [Parcubacteria group bacterium]
MCGIIGYIGKHKATPILVNGLKRLEYRGYDSSGIAIFNDGKIYLAKAKGRIIELEKKTPSNWDGNIGIAHTRWATHGEPNEQNAHPQVDCSGKIFVCHNGIIENYKELKEELIKNGHKFKSDTDTEVLSHLIEKNMRYGPELAIAKSLKLVKGTYGIVVLFANYPDRIIAARNSSPLVIGIGNGERLIASDASAILNRTRNVIYMNDGEMVVIRKDNIKLFGFNKNQDPSAFQGLNISKRKEKVEWTIDSAQKNGYPHFMLKEVFEQPESLTNSLRGRIIKNNGFAKLGGLEEIKNRLKKIDRIIISGCGTAYLAGAIGKLMIEELSGLPCEVELASELRYRNLPASRQNLAMVAISQSGETADTLAALRRFKEKNILTLGIVNVVGSTISRETDAGIYNHAGPEIGVASTKAFTSQLAVLALLALFLGRQRNLLKLDGKKIAEELALLPQLCHHVLIHSNKMAKAIAEKYKNFNNFLYMGRKYNFPTAFEGALKLKEISYAHAEGCGAGEMKHGPIAMIDENFPTIAIAPLDSVYDKMASNMEEIKSRHGKIIAITTEGNKKIKHIADDWLYIPKTLEMLTPILAVIPLQLFAYYMGVSRGLDVDKPRNLAKSVTVE